MIQKPFYVKRARAPKGEKNSRPVPVVLYASGFSDDTGETKSEIVLQVTIGSDPTRLRKTIQTLCDDLNAAWMKYYTDLGAA